jgi:hypothetical protein
MTLETRMKTAFVLSVLTSIWLIVMWNNSVITVKEQKQTIDSLINISDSLRDESFIRFTELGRYELSVEHLKQVNPSAAKQLTDFLENETE